MMALSGPAVGSSWTPTFPDHDSAAIFRDPERVPNRGRSIRRQVMAHKLFIGGLAFSTSTERLRELFAQAGAVESAAVVTDRDTGNSRGFGFVEMASAEAAADRLVAALRDDDGTGASLAPSAFAAYERTVRRHLRTYLGFVTRFYEPGFVDLFLQPTARMHIKEAVITLMAGKADPPVGVRARLGFFDLALWLQRSFGMFPRVPLLGVLEEERSP